MAIKIVRKKKQNNRKELNLQSFFNDMKMIDSQTKNPELRKPSFNIGDLSITNYLLWLILAELMMMNDREVENA